MRLQISVSLFFTLLIVSCSTDGPENYHWQWKLKSEVPILTKNTDVFEDNGIGSPHVLIDGYGLNRTFTMVYAQGSKDGPSDNHYGRIGRATSMDGINWTRYNYSGVILEPSFNTNNFDSLFLDTPCMIKVENTYYLYYFGDIDNTIQGGQIGLATSTDGIHFTRCGSNPVLSVGESGAWDDLWVESPDVFHDGMKFVMYYTGGRDTGSPKVGRATSQDGITWVKDPITPVLAEGGDWDGLSARVPGLVYRNGITELYYCSQSVTEAMFGLIVPKIGLATSIDGIQFSRYKQNPIVQPHQINNAVHGPYNPCVLFDDYTNTYYMVVESGIGFYALYAGIREN